MNVSDLKPKQGKVDIVLEVVEKGEPKEFSKFGSSGRVCNAKGKDETGEISVTLWNEQIDQV
ncbi:single-stranded DNA-binding protein, partial [Candidatus Woesearchaeota archaeon]|nr:single-stranded DNA-binding protein [Candidatus Woesearchaeota archaeon]